MFEDLALNHLGAEQAINAASLLVLNSHFKRLLTNYNFDPVSLKFQIYWARKKLGQQVCSGYVDGAKLEEFDKVDLLSLLRSTADEAKKRNGSLNMCRLQSQNGLIVVHSFDVMNFLDENQQSEHKLD